MTTTPLSDSFLRELAEQLRTQDNHITEHPLYVVEERERILGDWDSADGVAWITEDGEYEFFAGDVEFEVLEKHYRETGESLPDHHRHTYAERWRFVTCCLTMASARHFADTQKHRYSGPLRVYVASAHRNHEMIALREWLISSQPKEARP